jgi:hypothetical protein
MRLTHAIRTRVARDGQDAGMAMIVVILGMSAAMVTSLAGLAYATSTLKVSRHDQDWNGALTAAQAGIDDYISHLNRNDSYGRTWDCTNAALAGPDEPGNTCGWTSGTATGYLPVNPGQPTGPKFHYSVVSSQLDSTGTIQVTSTGNVNGVTRKLQAAVGRGGSTDYVYYTDHEDADPANTVMYPGGMPANCGNYWWQGRSTNDNGCMEITFIGGDVLDGKVHTNDTPLYTNRNGVMPEFKQGVETADPRCKNAVIGNTASYVNCDRTRNNATYDSSYPSYKGILNLVDNSSQFGTYPGCQYVGSTRIKLLSNGTMQVWSFQSTGANTPTAACGGSTVSTAAGATVTVPTDQTVYVTAGGTVQQCVSGQIGDGLPLGTYNGAAPTGSNQTYTEDVAMTTPDQFCGQGNLYIEGTLSGRLTLAAENSVVITGDLKLAGGLNGADLMGLVAGNSVEVQHPVMGTWTSLLSSGRWTWKAPTWQAAPAQNCPASFVEDTVWPHTGNGGIEIDASIQTLQHSFTVQNYNCGTAQGSLVVRGSIAQEWRGVVGATVGNSLTGYTKAYGYDTRLKYSSPPYFPQWTNAVWSIRHLGQL